MRWNIGEKKYGKKPITQKTEKGFDMNMILLSGGSGKRLWPLSNEVRSKQFLKIYKLPDGTYESMVQRVYRQIKSIDADAKVTIATSKSQISSIINQLGNQVGLSVEPSRRDTFPAISLAVAYMHDVLGVDAEDSVSVCPVDHYVDSDYYRVAEQLGQQALKSEADLVLMGIQPTYPSDKYGYIIPCGNQEVDWVEEFKEKPDVQTAKEYIARGALWNAGVFAFKLKYVLDTAEKIFGTSKYADLYAQYNELTKISFDYAVVEKTEKIQVVRYAGAWRDIGSWSTLSQTMTDNTVGRVITDDHCENFHVINDLDIPVLCMGLQNITVAASPDGVLIADNRSADQIKGYVEKIDQGVMYAEKSWGVFHVLDVGQDSLTIKVTMKAHDHMNYHSHNHRDEVWTVVSGQGRTIVDGAEQTVGAGDVITLPAGCKHTVFSITDLVLIEVQLGENISADDKQKFEMPS